jgi:hypothetical protein
MKRSFILAAALLWAAEAVGQPTGDCPNGYGYRYFEQSYISGTGGTVTIIGLCLTGWLSIGGKSPDKCPDEYSLLRDDTGEPVCGRDLRSPK